MIRIERLKLKRAPLDIYNQFKDSAYSFFLDSALTSEKLGQFSFIGIEPFLVFSSKKDSVTLDWIAHKETKKGNPFLILKDLFKQYSIKHDYKKPIPFIGGGVGYFAYDLKEFNERLPNIAEDDINIPDSAVCFYDTILGFDHSSGEYFIASSGFPEKGKNREYRQKARLEYLKNRIEKGRKAKNNKKNTLSDILPSKSIKIESNFTKDSYIKAVERAKEYIREGDIYQVNLSQRFKADTTIDSFSLYKILRRVNPAPFACFLNFGEVKVASASPERFLKKDGRHIQTRPIKGTRPRGRDPFEDIKMKEELMSSVKDRAENLMIIDLERNDLGRISEYGTVRVREFMTCEEYATVFHLVSTIEGIVREGADSMDCLVSCFPGGSITGAPKIRSMEIIEELEPVKRSLYTGTIGYMGFDGDMDTSIVIRTFIIKDNYVYFQVGGGIVADSDPAREYQETLDKARALIEAVSHEDSVSGQEIPAT